MPFDISGNFTRSYNFVQDRDNGIKILASRVDGEFDNFATGMNAVFFRDGRVPMQADLRMSINRITGLADGSVASPALKFNTDASTGPYLDGLSRYAISVNGTQRGLFTTTGLSVTGDLQATTGSIAGATIATQPWVSGAYAPKDNPVFTTGIKSPQVTIDAASGVQRPLFFMTAGSYAASISLETDNVTIKHNVTTQHRFDVNGTQKALISSSGISTPQVNITGATGAITIAPRDATGATPVIYSGTGGMIQLSNGAGADIAQFNTASGLQMIGSTALIRAASNADKYGFTHNRVANPGQAGYHMYNGGAVVEWVMHQPVAASGHDLRFSSVLTGTYTDRMKLATDGKLTVNNDITTTRGDGTGALYFGGGSQSIYFNGTLFSVSAAMNAPSFQASGMVSGVSPGGTTGGIRSASVSGDTGAYFQWTNNAQSVAWGYMKGTSDGKMYFSGAVEAQGNITSLSDARFKMDVRDLENGLALAKALRPVRFTMHGKSDLGFIAQEVERVMPEVVSTNQDGIKSLDYGRMSAVLAAGLQSLSDRVERIERFLVL